MTSSARDRVVTSLVGVSTIRWKFKRSEYLQLMALLALAHKHVSLLDDLEREMCAITGEEYRQGGHTGDAIYSGYTVDELLRKLKGQYGGKK